MMRNFFRLAFVIGIAAVASSADSGDSSSGGAKPPPDIKILIDALRSREEAMRRCQIVFNVDHKDWGFTRKSEQKPSPSVHEVHKFKETCWDGMKRMETYDAFEGNQHADELIEIETFDRAQYRKLKLPRQRGIISSDPKRRMRNFDMILKGFFGSLADELETNARDVKVAVVPHGDSQVISVEWKNGNWNRRLYLDPRRRLLPILVENSMDYDKEARRSLGYLRSVGRRTVEESRMMDGVLIPSRVSVDAFAVLENGGTRPHAKETIRIVEFRRLRQQPAPETFRLVFPAGTRVSLTDIQVSFTVGGNPKELDQAVEKALNQAIAGTGTELDGEGHQVPSATRQGGGAPSHKRGAGSSDGADAERSLTWLWLVVFAAIGVALLTLGWLKIRQKPQGTH